MKVVTDFATAKAEGLFPALLGSDAAPDEVRAELTDAGFGVDYIVDRDGRRFGAVHVGGVRLIDSVAR